MIRKIIFLNFISFAAFGAQNSASKQIKKNVLNLVTQKKPIQALIASYVGTEFYPVKKIQACKNFAYILALAYSPDGRHLAIGSNYESINIWNAHTWELVKEIDASNGHTDSV